MTSTSTSTAARYLDQTNYNIAQAIDLYYSKHSNYSRPANGSTNSNTATTTTTTRGAPKPAENSALVAIFDAYKDPSNDQIIDIDGTLKYLEDLEIDPDDPKSLTLAFLFKSRKVGEFQRESFLQVWQNYKIADIAEMSKFITKFHNDLIKGRGEYHDIVTGQELNFKKLYEFAFTFLLETENQKVLDVDLAISYWQLLLPLVINQHFETTQDESENGANKATDVLRSEVNDRVNNWYDFLTTSSSSTTTTTTTTTSRKVISFDTWSMFLPFFQEVILTDPHSLKGYDEMAAWPSKVDEYVEYLYDNNLLKESQ